MRSLLLILMLLAVAKVYAQLPILPLSESGWNNPLNTYYRDTDNELDSFVGTYLYTEGNTSLKIVLKKELSHYNGRFYEDRIYGEYQYIKDGVEIINTLIRLDDNIVQTAFSRHEIQGNFIIKTCRYLPLDDCTPGEHRLDLEFYIPNESEYYGDIILKHRVINGQPALKGFLILSLTDPTFPEGSGRVMPVPVFPWQQEYVFMKQ